MRTGIDARLWNESGVGRYTRNLIENLFILDTRNSYVLFVNSLDAQNIKDQISNIKNKETKEIKIVETNIRWHSVKEQLKFPSVLKKENLDLMHFPYFSVPIFYNKPYVVTIHDLIINHFPTGQASTLPLFLYKLKLLGYRFVLKQAVKKAKKIITVSNATKDEIIEHLKVDSGKVVVTYEGADEKVSGIKYQVSSEKNTKYKILNTKYFLYVGNAYPHKNLERLIEAFQKFKSQESKVKNEIQKSKLILVGKEDYFYKRLKTKVKKLNLEISIIFYGEASDNELSELYKNAKALIMPSLMEGFGLPVLEAMSNKCLVICSDIPSFRELASDSAIYLNPNSVEDMAEKIREVQCNDVHHYTENIKKGFERSKKFSWKKMGEQTLQIYSLISRM